MADLEIPERLNAATGLVDAHLAQGRGPKTAILCGDRAVTYAELHECVNRLGNALLGLDVRMEERVAIIVPDMPEWVFAFFAAMKIGAVAVPINTSLKPQDYEYLLNDCRARVLVIHPALLGQIEPVRSQLRFLKYVVLVGDDPREHLAMGPLMREASPVLEPADTSKDDMAFWLYSSGTTGFPKGTIHLHHDMLVAAEFYARQTIGLAESDVSFSVAKLFFAYGLGNGLYFSLYLGGTTVLLPDRPTPEKVLETLDRHRPTVFYSVPTSYAALLHAAEKSGRERLGRVRMCVSAGEPLPKHIFDKWLQRFGVEILDGIGSTEILHIFISNRPGKAVGGSTGQVVPGYEAKVCDDDGARAAAPPCRHAVHQGGQHRRRLLEQARGHQEHLLWRVDQHPRQVPLRRGRLLLVRRADRRHDEGQRPGRLADRRRGALAGPPRRLGKRRRRRRRSRRPDQARRLRGAQRGLRRLAATGPRAPGIRQAQHGPLQISPGRDLHGGPAEDGHRQDPAFPFPRAGRPRDAAPRGGGVMRWRGEGVTRRSDSPVQIAERIA